MFSNTSESFYLPDSICLHMTLSVFSSHLFLRPHFHVLPSHFFSVSLLSLSTLAPLPVPSGGPSLQAGLWVLQQPPVGVGALPDMPFRAWETASQTFWLHRHCLLCCSAPHPQHWINIRIPKIPQVTVSNYEPLPPLSIFYLLLFINILHLIQQIYVLQRLVDGFSNISQATDKWAGIEPTTLRASHFNPSD